MMTNEKLEKKYGNPFLKYTAKTDLAKDYYERYLECQRERHMLEIEALIAYIVAFLFVMLSALTEPYTAIPGALFLCVGVQCSCNARIEILWGERFADGIFETERIHKVKEVIEKVKEAESASETVAKEDKK